ncbi:MAG: tetratricopeptide repeat protein, partial [Candidatus Gastranaerophilaceae bacterium]
NFTFKNKLIWKVVYNLDLSKENKNVCYTGINKGLTEYTETNAAILAENLIKIDETPQNIISVVEQAAQEAYSVGDNYAYTELKTIIIDYLEKTTIENKKQIKYEIYEDIGKLNFDKKPEEAIKYFTELIKYYEENNNSPKVISLSGFLAKSFEITGNFAYAVECTDKALEMFDKYAMPYEYALLSYTKLEHLLNLGRFEELIVLSKTTVLPELEDIKAHKAEINGFEPYDIDFIEIDTRYITAKALALQGNKECLKEAEILLEMANQRQDNDYAVKSQLIIAHFKTLQGQNIEIKTILDELKNVIPNTKEEVKNYIDWHFVNTLNNLFAKDYGVLKQDLSELINFVVSTGAYSYQPLFKALWGKVLFENNEIARANDIYYELLNFCSENKLASGALLLWYLLTETEIKLQNLDNALSIAEKALEVAKNPTIKNHFFIMLFQKRLAEIHVAKSELDMAAMYAEQAIQLAQNLDLTLWQVKLSLLCGQIFKMKAIVELNERTENTQKAYKMHLEALELVKKIQNTNIVQDIENSTNELNQFCQKESINV